MKTLILLRHAHALPHHPQGDHRRDLSPQGEDEARRLGAALQRLDLPHLRLLTSSAARAQQTARLLGLPDEPEPHDALYDTTPAEALAWLRDLPGDDDARLVVGHQPTWGALASALIGGGQLNVGTAHALGLGLTIDRWSDLRHSRAWLLFLLPPLR